MKLPLVCPQCMHIDVTAARPVAVAEFRDDSRYEITCPEGHRGVVVLQQQKFEVLFDIGAYAIGDGYYREAVSTFTASLERCLEFFIRAMAAQRAIPPEVVEAAWKSVAAQSERQLGAFVFLYTIEFGRAPDLLPPGRTTFRNEVIHKGRIPSKTEALQYGQAVLDLIRRIVADAQARFPGRR